MNNFRIRILIAIVLSMFSFSAIAANITGEMKTWHRVTLTFDGPETSEKAESNPFLNYRLNVTFTNGSDSHTAAGFYAADGNAAETSATAGSKWRVHFMPEKAGKWSYVASFRKGKDVAIDRKANSGKPIAFDGDKGTFTISPTDKTGRDFRAKGLLEYTGKRYLKFAQTIEYFIKGGADSPENFLAYEDFDGTFDAEELNRSGEAAGSKFIHAYKPHLKDFRLGDPTWKNGKGKSIIGALNYLASQKVNSVYFLTMNVTGDGKDVWPWTGYDERHRFDCSKLDQWEIVFTHMDQLGIMMHVITQETENDQLLDSGALGKQRKLYYRELIARFAHHPAIVWNLGEENTNTDEQRKEFCDYFERLDPYDHPIVVHTYGGEHYEKVYRPLLGFENIEGASLQVVKTHWQTKKWLDESKRAGRQWVVCLDEVARANEGVKPDADDYWHDEIRKNHLWANLMAGGAGVEWYFGYQYAHNDLNCEDWRSREHMWELTAIATDFFYTYLPFTDMNHADELTDAADDYCFAKPGEVYAVYMPNGGTTKLDLANSIESFSVKWYNPRRGGKLLVGTKASIKGPGKVSIGTAPKETNKDWVALIKAQTAVTDTKNNNRTLFDFDRGFDTASVKSSDATIKINGKRLKVRTGHDKDWPGITLKAPDGKWDGSKYRWLSLEITNTDTKAVTVSIRVDNPGADGNKNCVTNNIQINPGQTQKLMVELQSKWVLSKELDLIGMRGNPKAMGKIDPSNITQLIIFVNKPKVDHLFEIDNIILEEKAIPLDADNFLPFIDKYGQFIHDDWPGKTQNDRDLKLASKDEQKDIARHPGPKSFNKYGGWADGPKLKATGFFRVEKYEGKWWLVDPTGRLFWSHGIDCVHDSTSTPISDRENYFSDLPEKNSPLAKFYGRASWAPHGYYKDHSPYRTYDLFKANLSRKYGDNWQEKFSDLTHTRLRSWGLNTIANWSDVNIRQMQRTPYVGTIHFSSRMIEGSEGYWGKFHDVFDENFRNNLRSKLKNEKTANDPWCIGYFVHNELSWGDDTSLAIAALKSPADQPIKIEFAKVLKAKYSSIEKLNAAWDSEYESWQGLLESRNAPKKAKAEKDLNAFYKRIADTYFEIVRSEVKAVAPNQLYMGCRFAWVNDTAAKSAAKFCDIVCYNRYKYSVADLKLPDNIDKPIIIGEFHFGALDRGMFHTGLKAAADQNDRAAKYKSYVQGALKNKYIVGTHWFQYKNQATTGRGDGENYQIGFVDICDKPYPDIIQTARKIGDNMYEYRMR